MRVLIQDRDDTLLGEIDLDHAPHAGDCIHMMSGDTAIQYNVLSRRFVVGPCPDPGTGRHDVQLVVLVRPGCAVGAKGYDWGAECPGGRAAPLA